MTELTYRSAGAEEDARDVGEFELWGCLQPAIGHLLAQKSAAGLAKPFGTTSREVTGVRPMWKQSMGLWVRSLHILNS